jgi:sugar lactone lactonase YvrE
VNLYYPQGVGVDSVGNVYISDTNNQRIRKVVQVTGILSTVAGTGSGGIQGEGGPATAARVYNPLQMAVDAAGNVYFADYYNDRVRKLTVATGILSTVAGSATTAYGGDGGLATAAQLNYPQAVAVDSSGSLYIADSNNNRLRKVSTPVKTMQLSTVAGTGTPGYNGDGEATGAQLYYPQGVAVDSAGNVYISDSSDNRIRKVSGGVISTVAGTGVGGFSGEGGPATAARVYSPLGLAIDGSGNLFFADYYNNRIRKVAVGSGIITTVAGSGATAAVDNVVATASGLNSPTAVAVDSSGNLYIADYQNHRIRKVAAGSNTITTVAGNGTAGVGGDGGLATAAQLNYPQGIAVDSAGNLYIGDTNNHRIRKVTAVTGIISTFAGTGIAGYLGENGPATAARLNNPIGMAVDSAGNVFVVDQYNHRVRRISAGVITTVVGSGDATFGGDTGAATAGQLNYPDAVAVAVLTGNLFVADFGANQIVLLIPTAPGQ